MQACGVCHSNLYTKEGLWPGLQFPRVPGHEAAGVIDEVGSGVSTWKKGDRAGVGWHGGQDNTCPACRAGDFANCESNKITGITYGGGFEQYMIAPIEAVARIPNELEPAEAAPPLCAEITTFNALRNSGAGPAISSRFRVSVDLATWAFSSRINLVTEWPPSDAARKMPHSQKNLVRAIILTVVLAAPQSS